MTNAASEPRRVRLVTALLLVAMFAAGTLTGAALDRWLSRPPWPPPHHHGPKLFPPLPLEELDLDAAQREQVRAILAEEKPKLDRIFAEGFPKVRAFNAGVEVRVRGVLSERQRTLLDQLKAKRPPPPPPGFLPGPPPPGVEGLPPGPPPFESPHD